MARRRAVGQLRGPQRRLLHVAVVGDPLGLDAVGHQRVRDARRDLHARAAAAAARSTKSHGGDQPSTSNTRPRAVRRAGSAKTTPKPETSTSSAVGDLHRAAEPEGGEVGAGHLHPQLVAVDAGDGQPGRAPAPAGRRRCRSRGRARDAGRRPSRPARRGACATRRPGGLLEAVGGEVHPRGVVAELRHGPRPQVDLGQRRGRVLGATSCRGAARSRSAPGRRRGRRTAAVARTSSAWPGSVSSQRKASRSTRGHPVRPPTGPGPIWHSWQTEC